MALPGWEAGGLRASQQGAEMAASALGAHLVADRCVSASQPPPGKDTCHVGLAPTNVAPFSLNHRFRDHFSKRSHVLKSRGLGRQHRNF